METEAESGNTGLLVQSALAGKQQAFNHLVDRYFGVVYSIAYAHLQHREAAEDLTQEVFLRAHLCLGQLRDPSRFPAWLGRMARNCALQWLRAGIRASRLVAMVPLEEGHQEMADTRSPDTRTQIVQDEEQQAVRQAIAGLPADLREVIMLHHVAEVSLSEIARQQEVHLSTISRRHGQALKQLHGVLEPVIRASVRPLAPTPQVAVRTVAILAAATALSGGAKASIAAQVAQTGGAAGASVAASGLPAAFVSLLHAIGITTTVGGTMIMSAKTVTIGVAAAALVAGGVYWSTQGSEPVSTSATLAAITPAAAAALGTGGAEAAFRTLQQDLQNKNFEGIAAIFGRNAQRLRVDIEADLADDTLGVWDYMAKGELGQIDPQPDGSVRLRVTEPFRKTRCSVHFVQQNGQWRISDVNEVMGMGMPLSEAATVSAIPETHTDRMSGEDVIKAFYGALIAKEFDRAAGFLQFSNPEKRLQYRNVFKNLLGKVAITETREVEVTGMQGFARFGVQQGFPGAGIPKLRSQDERQARLTLVTTPTGLKIDGERSRILGDSPGDY